MNQTERRNALFVSMKMALQALAERVDHSTFPLDASKEEESEWVTSVMKAVGERMTRTAGAFVPLNVACDKPTADHYRDAIGDLRAGLHQLEQIERGEGYPMGCLIGGDDHHAGVCHHNPLILAAWGTETLLGPVWKCFHCGCVFTTEEGARNHFGSSVENAAKCVAEQVEVLTYRAEQLTTLRAKAPEISDDLARAASALRGVRRWLLEAKA
jgi:hypothetical protein